MARVCLTKPRTDPLQKMSTEWCSEENLRRAWRYVKKDIRDDFIVDVINNTDIEYNLEHVIATLSAQLKSNQYHPAPLLRVGVPKNDHSSRPGTSLSIVDLIVLYAIAQRLAPLLDPYLCESVYSFRLNPKAGRSELPLFKDKTETQEQDAPEGGETEEVESDFPYDWFFNWNLVQRSAPRVPAPIFFEVIPRGQYGDRTTKVRTS